MAECYLSWGRMSTPKHGGSTEHFAAEQRPAQGAASGDSFANCILIVYFYPCALGQTNSGLQTIRHPVPRTRSPYRQNFRIPGPTTPNAFTPSGSHTWKRPGLTFCIRCFYFLCINRQKRPCLLLSQSSHTQSNIASNKQKLFFITTTHTTFKQKTSRNFCTVMQTRGTPDCRCLRTRARPKYFQTLCSGPEISGPHHDQIVWLCCGPKISGPQHDQKMWLCCGSRNCRTTTWPNSVVVLWSWSCSGPITPGLNWCSCSYPVPTILNAYLPHPLLACRDQVPRPQRLEFMAWISFLQAWTSFLSFVSIEPLDTSAFRAYCGSKWKSLPEPHNWN